MKSITKARTTGTSLIITIPREVVIALKIQPEHQILVDFINNMDTPSQQYRCKECGHMSEEAKYCPKCRVTDAQEL